MASERLMSDGGPRYVRMQSEPGSSFFTSFGSGLEPESSRIFDELPESTIVSVSRPEAGDISPLLLSYTIEFQYKQVRNENTISFFMQYLTLNCDERVVNIT